MANIIQQINLKGITKRFPGILANDQIDLDVRKGEVHALLGENGAGKSTLMKILYGMIQPDSGEIRIDGTPVKFASPADAIKAGIGMVHQHFMLVSSLTVAENVALGLRSSRRPMLDLAQVTKRVSQLSEQYGLKINPKAYIWQLSVGEQQRVEIIKALYRDTRVLILDEPTAVLTPPETVELFKVFRQMTENDYALLFISHKLPEVLDISQQITVLRDGRVTGTLPTQAASRDSLVRMMVGRDLAQKVDHNALELGAVRLSLQNLSALNDRRTTALTDVSLEIAASEIVGIAGVSGNGQRELAEVIAGLRSPTNGQVILNGKDITNRPVSERIAAGLAYIPEERMIDGAIKSFSVAENAMLHSHNKMPCSKWGVLREKQIKADTQQLIDTFNVKTPYQSTLLRNLSGGNIQKLILARELSRNPQLLIAAQPTRGVDISATLYIHRCLLDQRAQGTAILLISEDLDELLSLSDRIAVLYEGKIAGILPRAEATAEKLGELMTGNFAHV